MLSLPAISCSPIGETEAGSSRNPARTTDPETPDTANTSTTEPPPSSTIEPSSGADPGEPLSESSEMRMRFTYRPDESGRVHFPYIAVWIEDTDGRLIDTVSLWFKEDEAKYLDDLSQWEDATDDVDGDALDAISSPTRVPGEHAVAWNLTDLAGNTIEPGSYRVLIEAAREDGPYQIVSGTVQIDGSPKTAILDDDGELVDISVEVT